MHVEGNQIDLGIVYSPRLERLVEVSDEVGEVSRIEEVIGGGLEAKLEPTITAARKACGKPNCCLTASARATEEVVWRTATSEGNLLKFLRVELSCAKEGDPETGCEDFLDGTTKRLEGFFEDCLEVWQAAEFISQEVETDGERRAVEIRADGKEKADKVVRKADKKADRAIAKSLERATTARTTHYATLREELEAGVPHLRDQ